MKPPSRHSKTPVPGQVRIIAGHLRGSKLPVLQAAGLRPSSDRVRETVFNWLQMQIPAARVLDAFAGSGALGIEACSRGAASVLMLEQSIELVRNLQAQIQRLKIQDSVQAISANAYLWLQQPRGERFDIVFLDPPFADDDWHSLCKHVDAVLSPSAWIYLESAQPRQPQTPAHWRLHREGRSKEVRYALYQRDTTATLAPAQHQGLA
jgi:16S rRNA (guanine966-N2)-methyltransferase